MHAVPAAMRERHMAALAKLREREVVLQALSGDKGGGAWEEARL